MYETIKRGFSLVIAAATALAITSGVAWAQNPHFIDKFTKASLDDEFNLVVGFKEAGLGDNQNIDYELTADATATYQCLNNGGQCPNAANKQDVAGPVVGTATLNSGKNGQIKDSLTANPPPADLDCPGNQVAKVTSVVYSNILLTDTTNSLSTTPMPDTLGASFDCEEPKGKGKGPNN